MLRRRRAHFLLIAAGLVAPAFAQRAAEEPVPLEDEPGAHALPSRVVFQRADLRHRREELPLGVARDEDSRAVWLARLALEGLRPLRPAWRPHDDEASQGGAADRFARLTLDVRGTPPLLPLSVPDPERWARVFEALVVSSTCPCSAWGANPGRVPDGIVLLGPVLRASKNAANRTNLDLTWGRSCSDTALDYAVHEGTLGSWYSHQPIVCSSGGVPSTTLTPGAGNRYYLVVPLGDDAEGSYGIDSAHQERPPALTGCRPVAVGERCP